jgi:uncharacterized protein
MLAQNQKDQLIEQNRREYESVYHSLHWITPDAALRAEEERQAILSRLQGKAVFCCKNTKVDGHQLSQGCQICTEGHWSCLFLHSKCNSRCFYCPTRQDENLVPMTNTLPFPEVNDYLDYVQKFGFTGVSLSGGEPLLALDQTLLYLSKVTERFGASLYTWLYTNGMLVTDAVLQQLKETGLDELRFDIGATAMELAAAILAVRYIETVTVEIPALPEEFERLKIIIREMKLHGIQHLNLHQLRVTPYNLPHVSTRGYTFLHGTKVTILESELTALRLIEWNYDQNIGLPINYCSFVYKNRFQRSAARQKSARFIVKTYENITECGYIRSLDICGSGEDLQSLLARFESEKMDDSLWHCDQNKNRLTLGQALWRFVDFSRFTTTILYSEAKLFPAVTYRHYFKEIPLNANRSVYIEKMNVTEKIDVDSARAAALCSLLADLSPQPEPNTSDLVLGRLLTFEWIEQDLGEYF